MNKIAFNKENLTDLFSQIIKVLSRHNDIIKIKDAITKIREISSEIYDELKDHILQTASKEKIVLEKGVYYMLDNGKKIPFEMDAPPSFKATIIDEIIKKSDIGKKLNYRTEMIENIKRLCGPLKSINWDLIVTKDIETLYGALFHRDPKTEYKNIL